MIEHDKTRRCSATAIVLSLLLCGLWVTQALADSDKAFIVHTDAENLEWGPCPDYFPNGCGLAVLQGDPAEHNADVLLRVPGNSTIPHHCHTSAERMILVAGTFEVDYDGQDPVVMRAGTYAYGPPRLPHVAHCRSEEECLLFIAFEKPVDAIEGTPD